MTPVETVRVPRGKESPCAASFSSMPSHAIARTTLALVLFALVATAIPATASAAVGPSRTATVVRVLDGDTVRVRVSGRVGTIDLVGVRAPTGRQCFASTSRSALRRLLPVRSRIRIADETRVRGRGRYVTRGRALVNTEVLRRGAVRLGSLTGVARASALRAAERSGRTARRGLHRSCRAASPDAETPLGPGPESDGPAAQERAMRTALSGLELRDVATDTNSSTENVTRFCADGRAQRQEQTIFRNSPDQSLFTNESGSWAITNTARQADGSLAAEVLVRFDKASFETRTLPLLLGADGVVRMQGRAAQGAPSAVPCPGVVPDGTLDNDTPAARDGLLAALTGLRLSAAGRDSDFCPGRITRREGGAVVAEGAPVVEWAVSDPTGQVGLLRVEDVARGTSRRVLVALPAGTEGGPQIGELGRGDAGPQAATRATAAC